MAGIFRFDLLPKIIQFLQNLNGTSERRLRKKESKTYLPVSKIKFFETI
jgi:hypothetical protein